MTRNVVHVLPGKLGGVVSIVRNLVSHGDHERFDHHVVLTHNGLDVDAPFEGSMGTTHQTRFDYELPLENLHAVLRRLANQLPSGPGILVAHDVLELMMAATIPSDRIVVQMLHGDHDYYYDLAQQYREVIDVYVAYSRTMYDRLTERLPERRDDIVHLPYGIPMPESRRRKGDGALRAVFCGRLENGQKGIFDLPEIDRRLDARGCDVRWTVIGDGPDAVALKSRWSSTRVDWVGACTRDEVVERYVDQDVFVLPTRREGFPVALLEAMASGLVPIVSDIASGVREVVSSGETGYRPAVGDSAGFAEAIAELDEDRDRLEAMSERARSDVRSRFDIREAARQYDALFARGDALRTADKGTPHLHTGSRLDQPWIPNALVYPTRRGLRWLKTKS